MNVEAIALAITALCAVASLCLAVLNLFRIREVHLLVNSRLTQLLELTETSARAEGRNERP